LGVHAAQASSSSVKFSLFKIDNQVYLVIWKTLYSFTPLQVKPIKTLALTIDCKTCSYSRGTLYYDRGAGIKRSVVGSPSYHSIVKMSQQLERKQLNCPSEYSWTALSPKRYPL
jgi:hypothetical protein